MTFMDDYRRGYHEGVAATAGALLDGIRPADLPAQVRASLRDALAEQVAGKGLSEARFSIRYALSELEQHDADCLGSAAAVGRLRAALRETGEHP